VIEGNLSCLTCLFGRSRRPSPQCLRLLPRYLTSSHGAICLFFLSGNGDITINGNVTAVKSGTVCQVRAGEQHSLRNLGGGDRLVLTIYDPPRARRRG